MLQVSGLTATSENLTLETQKSRFARARYEFFLVQPRVNVLLEQVLEAKSVANDVPDQGEYHPHVRPAPITPHELGGMIHMVSIHTCFRSN